ncbi:hypothetical protein SPD48_04370 [Pseudogracilibacillus sp. SE30717A]
MNKEKKQESKQTNVFYDPPVHAKQTLRQDVERKREEIKKSTIGGF